MKPILGIFIGDTHVLSDTGLVIPGYKIGSKEQRPYSASAAQRFIHTSFLNFIGYAKKRAIGHRVFFGYGGDGVDGVNHHNTTQTSGVDDDQISMAVELLMPLVNMADESLGVTGTAAHVGDMGDTDRTICRELGVEVAPMWKVSVGPRRLWFAHHGINVGKREHLAENAAEALAKNIEMRCCRTGERKPDALVAHDRHMTFEPFEVRGIRVAVCPCWQLSTNHGNNWPFDDVSIGGLLWDVTSNVIERKLYEHPKAVKHIFDSD